MLHPHSKRPVLADLVYERGKKTVDAQIWESFDSMLAAVAYAGRFDARVKLLELLAAVGFIYTRGQGCAARKGKTASGGVTDQFVLPLSSKPSTTSCAPALS